jgi:flagellar protein FlbD
MISLKRRNGTEVVVNADHIITIESTPDTMLYLTSGERLMVEESVEQVVDAAVAYQRRVHGSALRLLDNKSGRK